MSLGRKVAVVLLMMSIGANAQVFSDTLYLNNFKKSVSFSDRVYTRIITNDTSGLIRFMVRDFTADGQLVFLGYFKSLGETIKTGEHTEYYLNGTIKSRKNYTNHKLHGSYQLYSNTGALLKSANYKNGALDGSLITYYTNGTVRREEEYNNNKFINGRCFTEQGNDTTYYPYIIPPSYRGGWQGFNKWIITELTKSESFSASSDNGSAVISVTISQKGLVDSIRVLNGNKNKLIQEAVNLIKQSTDWIPGLVDGKPSKLTIKIPLDFSTTKFPEK